MKPFWISGALFFWCLHESSYPFLETVEVAFAASETVDSLDMETAELSVTVVTSVWVAAAVVEVVDGGTSSFDVPVADSEVDGKLSSVEIDSLGGSVVARLADCSIEFSNSADLTLLSSSESFFFDLVLLAVTWKRKIYFFSQIGKSSERTGMNDGE